MIISKLIKDNSSLLISIFGALSLFASSLIMKVGTSNEFFVEYGRSVVLASMAFTWAPLGSDVYFLRYCQLYEGKIVASKTEYTLLLIASIVGCVFLSFFSVYYLANGKGDVLNSALLTSLVCICLLIFNFSKVLGEDTIAQYFSALWKFSFLFVALLSTFYYVEFNIAIFISGLFLSLFFYKKIKGSIIEKLSVSSIITPFHSSLWFAALFTITVVTLISQMDRLLVSRYLTEHEFAEYFFWSSIYFSPMTIFSSYYGTKKFNMYKKKKVERGSFYKDLYMVLVFVFMSVILSTFIGYFLLKIFPNKIDYPNVFLIFSVLFLGSIRAIYIFLSSIIQIYIEPKWAFRTGGLILLLFLLFIIIFENISIDLPEIIISLSIIWLIRTAQYFYFLKRKIFCD